MRRFVFGWIALFVAVPCASAQTMLELVPQDAVAGIAIRNLDELIKRGDKFLTETAIDVPLRPSQLFDLGAVFVGANRGLDRKRPAAVVLLSPEKGQNDKGLDWLEQNLVPILPFTDADLMASNYGLDKGKFLEMNVFRANRQDFIKYIARTKDHIRLCGSEKTLRRMEKGKFVSDLLSPEQRKLFDDDDFLFQLGQYLFVMENGSIPDAIAAQAKAGDDPEEKLFGELLAKGLRDVETALIGARIKDGIDGHFLATVPKGSNAAKMLAFLRNEKKKSSLHALPEGNVLFAQASAGDSAHQKLLAKAVFRFLLEDVLIRVNKVAHVDRLQYLGVFHEVWSRLDGHRIAVYQNVNETKEGLFSAVAILDVNDPAGFLRDMKTLAKMATAESLDFSKKDVQEEIDIPRLVKQLGSSVFAVRQSANTKLLLIGEPALPHLQKAIDSKELDLENLRRCDNLRQQISDVAAQRRKELLRESKTPLFFRPKLTFVSNVEKRVGQSIDVIQVNVPGLEKDKQAVEFKQLLGPDWDKLRLAVVGKQIVVLLGSDVALFDATLNNIQKNEPGLANTKRLSEFYGRASKERLFEFHVSVEGILRLTTPMAQLDTKLQLTSAALSVGPTSLQLDARVPTSEVRTLAKKVQDELR